MKLFFDQSILLNPAIGANGNCRLQDARYVKCVLFVEEELNGIKYTNPYDLGDLDWDYHKTNNHIYGLIEGMNITREYGERRIQKFAGNLYEAEQENLVLHMVNDFKNYDTTLNRVLASSMFGDILLPNWNLMIC